MTKAEGIFRPSSLWLLPLSIGLVITIAATLFVRSQEDRKHASAFISMAERRLDGVQANVTRLTDSISILALAMDGAGNKNAGGFQRMSQLLMDNNAAIQSVLWGGHVEAGKRAAYEGARRHDGMSSFEISERRFYGGLERADSRSDYYPLIFADFRNRTEGSLGAGLDLATDSTLKDSLARALVNGRMATSGRIVLGTDGTGIKLVQAAYGPHREVTGLIVAELRIRDMVPVDNKGVAVSIADDSGLLYSQIPDQIAPHPSIVRHIMVGDQDWKVEAFPSSKLEVGDRWQSSAVSMTGILLILAFVQVGCRRNSGVPMETPAAIVEAKRKESIPTDYVAVMSHCLRSPMNGVIGMTDLLLDTGLSGEQRHYTNAVRVSAEAVMADINDIVDLSKIDAGELVLNEHPFNLAALIEEVADIMAPRVRAKQLEMSIFVDPDLRGSVIADPARIRQVLVHLTSNAVKFTDGGAVSVSANRFTAVDGGESLRVTVADTGRGIPADVEENRFDVFIPPDTTSVLRHGYGLGLAITRRLVEAMGGVVDFTTEQGKGSSFWFTIPLRRSSEEEARAAAEIDGGGAASLLMGTRVLVVDNIHTIVATLCRQIEGWGGSVAAVSSAGAALAAMREAAFLGQGFDVALIEQNLPNACGLDLAGEIKADRSLAGIRLILVCGTPSRALLDHSSSIGFDGVLAIPVRPSALLSSLLMALGHKAIAATSAPAKVSAHKRPLRLLVAEDNAISQQVAMGLLAKLGHHAEIAANGSEAMAMIQGADYDMVFMDVQMPGMDGIAATQTIRAMVGPKAAIPIIAMTANAMSGDRENLLASGMDDYLAKPIRRQGVEALLGRWYARLSVGGEAVEKESAPEIWPIVDASVQAALIDDLGAELVAGLVEKFLAGLPDRMTKLEAAFAADDSEALAKVAHNLKGTSSSMGFARLSESARVLELAAKAGNGVASGFALLRNAFDETMKGEN